jgi:hypothetical protein
MQREWRKRIVRKLTPGLVNGTIHLQQYNAEPGDVIRIVVDIREPGSDTTGQPAVFVVTLHPFDWKLRVSPSLLFVQRRNVFATQTARAAIVAALDKQGKGGSSLYADNNPQASNFAPAPGVTAGFTIHARHLEQDANGNWRPAETARSRVLAALEPGLGVNVSFLNWSDSTSSSAPSNVQIGAGFLATLFGNKLQFTYGWNLQSQKPRTYIGVCFGFIELARFVTNRAVR